MNKRNVSAHGTAQSVVAARFCLVSIVANSFQTNLYWELSTARTVCRNHLCRSSVSTSTVSFVFTFTRTVRVGINNIYKIVQCYRKLSPPTTCLASCLTKLNFTDCDLHQQFCVCVIGFCCPSVLFEASGSFPFHFNSRNVHSQLNLLHNRTTCFQDDLRNSEPVFFFF